MYRDDYFENHPVYNLLPFHVIVGLIQLMIDEGIVDANEREGIYVELKDFRDKVRPIYADLNNEQKQEYIAFFRYRHHLFKPYLGKKYGIKF